jgi:5-methylcytosine-specific restriction endonuclease McrA
MPRPALSARDESQQPSRGKAGISMPAVQEGIMKTCTKCSTKQPLDQFCVDASRKDGRHPWCKQCRSRRGKAYYQDNRDSILAQQLIFRRANPEHTRAINRKSIAKNRDKLRAMGREYYRRNKKAVIKRIKRYHKTNPGYWRSWQHRRLRRLRTMGVHTKQDVRNQYQIQHGQCFWCHRLLGDKYHADHYIPVSKGGTNTADNIVIACPSCNLRKFNLMPDEFLARLNDEGQ